MVLNDCVKNKCQKLHLINNTLKGSLIAFSFIAFVFQANAKHLFTENLHSKRTTFGVDRLLKTITGKVVDESGTPISGAIISVKGKAANATTTDGGDFSINANEGDELVVTHISYLSKTVKLGSESSLMITLQLNTNNMEQVTITGYTNYARSKSPSSSTQIGAANINKVPMSSLDQILQGQVPGLSVISSSGQPGQSASVVIRGIGSISGSSAPLYIMDGVPVEAGYFQTINPEDIESMTVLKDASAKAMYGSRGSNGVIIITTKTGKKGRLSVNYSSQYGIATLTQPTFEMMDSRERLRFEEEVG